MKFDIQFLNVLQQLAVGRLQLWKMLVGLIFPIRLTSVCVCVCVCVWVCNKTHNTFSLGSRWKEKKRNPIWQLLDCSEKDMETQTRMHWNGHIKLQARLLSHLWHNNKKQCSLKAVWILGSDGHNVWRQTKRGNIQLCISIYVKMEMTFYFSSCCCCPFEWKGHFVLNITVLLHVTWPTSIHGHLSHWKQFLWPVKMCIWVPLV